MAENNALDTQENHAKWARGEIVEGIDYTIEEFKNNYRNAGWTEDAIQGMLDTIGQVTTKQATTAVGIDPTLVSTSGNTNASNVTVTTDTEQAVETDTPDLTNATEEQRKAAGNYIIQDGNTSLEFETQADGTVKVTDAGTGESGIYSTSGPTGSVLDGFLLSGTPNGHILWNNRDLTGYRQTGESTPGAMDYDPVFKTTESEAIEAAVAALSPNATNEEKRVAIENASAAWIANPLGGGTSDNPISGSGGGASAPQLGDLPSFGSQEEIDQDRYDSTSAAGKALAAGESLPSFSLATSPSTMKFFNNQTEMSMPTLRNLSGMTSSEIANWNPFARMTQKPEFNDLVSITQDRWGGRRTAPAATMGGFTQASSIMPSRAPRSTRSASATNPTPFGFKAQGSSRAAKTSFNRPSRLKAASIRSGRDGMIRGRGA